MGRKCNLELRLSLASTADDDDGGDHKPPCRRNGPSTNQQRCFSILHNGQISVCDVTELQARAIIWWASRCQSSRERVDHCAKDGEDIRLQLLVRPIVRGLSMKSSLQRFLQKRNRRIQSTSPYYRR